MRKMIFCVVVVLTAWPVLAEEAGGQKKEKAGCNSDTEFCLKTELIWSRSNSSRKEFEIRFSYKGNPFKNDPKLGATKYIKPAFSLGWTQINGKEHEGNELLMRHYDVVYFKGYTTFRPGRGINPYVSVSLGLGFEDDKYFRYVDGGGYNIYDYRGHTGLVMGGATGLDFYPVKNILLTWGVQFLSLVEPRFIFGCGLSF